MLTETKTAAPPTPARGGWNQTTVQDRTAIPQVQPHDAEPKEDVVSTSTSHMPKEAVSHQPHSRLRSGINANPYQPGPHSDWGINEESL